MSTTLDKSTQYVYNGIGNIVSVTKNGVTTQLGYDSDNPDVLTSYGSKTITYNSNGGVSSYDGWSYSWSKRRLTGISMTSTARLITPSLSPSKSYSFTYNAFGQRTGKSYSYFLPNGAIVSVQTGETTYYNKQFKYDASGRLIAELINEIRYGEGEVSKSLKYLYDESGMIGVQYTNGSNTNTYYYLRNLQGDVIGIYNTSGAKVVGYTYDAWGNCTIDSSTTNYELAHDNPIRYRGYYYDEDTGLYYLNSRYYNPEWRRFISSDDTAFLDSETPNGLNLYCYCGNDPVMLKQTPISSNYAITTAISIGSSNNVGGSSGSVASGINWRQALSYIRGMFSTYTDYSRKIVSVDLDFIWFGYEQGEVYNKIVGNDSAPIALFTKVAEEPWKFWNYKIGIKHNIGNFSYSYGQGIGEADISFALGNSSTDITLGIFKMGIGFSHTIDDNTYYNQVYIRPAAILFSLVIAKWAIPLLLKSMEQSRIPQGAY